MLRNSITTRLVDAVRAGGAGPLILLMLRDFKDSSTSSVLSSNFQTKKKMTRRICGANIEDWAEENKVEVMEEEEERIPPCVFTVYSYSQSCR